MDHQAIITESDLECMLFDETAEPKPLPFSLLERITKDFSYKMEIGRGAFAMVYKGKLEKGVVAVKRLTHTYKYEKEFIREVECLMKVQHRNIVRFLGYCVDTQGNMVMREGKYVMADIRQRLLCFEYLPNGALNHYIKDPSCGLEWTTRYNIIKGICEGLHHLHQLNIVHLDLKPANILLDENMEPKITDFGISRSFEEDQSRIIATKVLGTPGYMAPEFVSHLFTKKYDLYSLGVIIMEILTGEKTHQYVETVLKIWSDRLTISRRNQECDQIRVCVDIGIECMDFDPANRPDNIKQIIQRFSETERIEGQRSQIELNPRRYQREPTITEPNMESIQGSKPHALPLQHLKEITNNFSDERILGHGGFGVVYKGVLQNGEMVAVKKIIPSFMSGTQNQFENAVCHMMKLKHPNIVRFIGYCFETHNTCLEFKGKHMFAEATERLLCLEYLPNGSLANYLSDESSGLDWSTRYQIIEGICHGLCHLHEQVDKCIIHLDLKPTNILLDDAMVPKITDFGLSRLLDKQQTIHTSSRDATFGYMAPEFLQLGTITPKADIFSLGVIIVEVITGHRYYPDDTRASSDDFIELTLKKWRDVLQRPPVYESLETDCEQIKRCIQIGLICLNPDHKKRPPIKKVISMLQGLDIIDCDIINEEA